MIRLPGDVAAATDFAPYTSMLSTLRRWGRDRGTPVGAVVPPVYEAYARVFHPASTRDEVDFRWTYVGGTRSCIDAVLADERQEAMETHPDQHGDYLSDSINGPVRPG